MTITLSNRLFKLIQLDETTNWQCYAEPKYVYAKSIQDAVQIIYESCPEKGLQFVIEKDRAIPIEQKVRATKFLQSKDDHCESSSFVDITADLLVKLKRDSLELSSEDEDLQKEMFQAYLADYAGIDLISGNKQEFLHDVSKNIKSFAGAQLIIGTQSTMVDSDDEATLEHSLSPR